VIDRSPAARRPYRIGSIVNHFRSKILRFGGLSLGLLFLVGSAGGIESSLVGGESGYETSETVAQETNPMPSEAEAESAAGSEPAAETPAATSSTESSVASNRPEPIPVLPGANRTAWEREVWLIALMFVMGAGCTIIAAVAFWMLGKNSHPRT